MILSCQNISKSFGTDLILDHISFHIEDHEKAAIVGINGAGKSTLLKIITGELAPDEGQVAISRTKTLGYLSQLATVSSGNTIYDEVMEAKKDVIEIYHRMKALEQEIQHASGDALESALNAYARLTHAYEDANGYAIYVEETEYNIADYAYLRALQGSSSAFGSDKAALITYDGKMKTVDTKEDYTSDFSGYTTEKQIGSTGSEIVLVKEASNGEYRLKDLDTKNPSIAKAEDSFELRNGVARINLTATGVATKKSSGWVWT